MCFKCFARKIELGKQDEPNKMPKGWPEPVEAEGKMLFWNEFDHDVVVMLHWKDGEFKVIHRDFN